MAEYIERKKAIELIQPHVKPQTVYGEGYLQAIEHATDILELMPAADVQSVKHGRWSECYTDSRHYSGICSVCCKASIKSLAESLYAFCPKCGARMDGDTNG